MYSNLVKTKDEAVCHLFFHCCLKDGQFRKEEIEVVSARFVGLDMHKRLNFKEEIIKYQSYKPGLTDEVAFIKYLVKLINPVNELALFSYCVEMTLGDKLLEAGEESMLEKIGAALMIEEPEQSIAKKVMIQRKAVESEKLF